MGVFTVGRQVTLNIDMPPGWWLADASVDMDFQNGRYFDSSTANPRAATDFLSCTRASVGYAKTAAGTLTSFASNALRITSAGLLCEDARTNEFVRSEEMNISWGNDAIIVTADQAVAPDGNTTMDKLNDSTGTSHHFLYQNVSVTALESLTFSAFFKDIDRRYVYVYLTDISAAAVYSKTLDLQTGLSTQAGGVAGTGNTFTGSLIETYSGGVYRLSVSGKVGSSTNIFGVIALSDTPTPTISAIGDYSYTGSNKSVCVWGAQFERNAVFPSSYIPTTSAAATRAAENITTSSSLQTTINAATGSLVAQTDNGGGASFAANIVDSNGTNLLGFDASNHALASMVGTLATANTANRTTQDKFGLAWSASGRSLVLNGGTVATDASAQTPSATQHVGSSGTTNFAYAYIERLTAFNTKLADATLQGFTV